MVFNGLFGKKKQALPPPPPKPRVFDMDNIFDVIEYCILKAPDQATDIITKFLEEHPDQLEKRYTDETKPENGAYFYRSTGSTPIMMLMRYNGGERNELTDYTDDGQRYSKPTAIFEWALFENLIKLGADVNAKCDEGIPLFFYASAKNKDLVVKLFENGLEYKNFFNGEKRSVSINYSEFVHYAILDFESGKMTRLDDQTAALSHIFYAKASQYQPTGHFNNYKNNDYLTRKRLLIDFEQSAVHKQIGHSGSDGYRYCTWQTTDIESFDTYANPELIQRARLFLKSGKQIEDNKPQTVKRGLAPIN